MGNSFLIVIFQFTHYLKTSSKDRRLENKYFTGRQVQGKLKLRYGRPEATRTTEY
jgi:hypothetical protein